jgi:2,4-dienoyl-CoA reductase-like NADH-dependent reductase (Old Yellow Enzyme family)
MAGKVSPFDPVQIGPITLRNRFIKAGANEGMVFKGAPSKALLRHHRDLAAGGVGMTTAAYGAVAKIGRTLPNQVWLRPEIIPDLKALADAVHAEGGRMSYQITHGGSFVTGIKLKERTMSACGGFNKAGLLSGNFFRRAMNEDDMAQVIGEFVAVAKICREAGIDAVELHMGHGYLLNQFVSPLDNKRKDQYGGNAENRMRFPAAVLAAVKQAVGKDMAVLAKINVTDGVKVGATVDDAIVTARALQAAGADMLVLSAGRNVESGWLTFGSNHSVEEMEKVLGKTASLAFKLSQFGAPKIDFKELYLLEYSRRIRASVTMPLAYLGGAKSLENAQQALDEGFDAVVMARALIHNPNLVNQFQRGEATQSGCLSCNRCVPYIYHPAGTCCPVTGGPNDLALNQQPASA